MRGRLEGGEPIEAQEDPAALPAPAPPPRRAWRRRRRSRSHRSRRRDPHQPAEIAQMQISEAQRLRLDGKQASATAAATNEFPAAPGPFVRRQVREVSG